MLEERKDKEAYRRRGRRGGILMKGRSDAE
jgi:hypothetical protein